MPLLNYSGFPSGSDSKESTCLLKTWVQSLTWKIPLEEDMGICVCTWRIPCTGNLVGYTPWSHNESDTA